MHMKLASFCTPRLELCGLTSRPGQSTMEDCAQRSNPGGFKLEARALRLHTALKRFRTGVLPVKGAIPCLPSADRTSGSWAAHRSAFCPSSAWSAWGVACCMLTVLACHGRRNRHAVKHYTGLLCRSIDACRETDYANNHCA